MASNQNSETLSDKNCSIEKLVTIPNDIEKVLTGRKTATRRNDIYADVGEVMILQNQSFKIENVYSQYLGDMTDADAQQEGYDNLDAYKDSILSIHPGMKWAPKMKVWVHEYAPAK